MPNATDIVGGRVRPGHGLLATGHSGNNEGKCNLSDEKVLTGRVLGPEEGRAWRVC